MGLRTSWGKIGLDEFGWRGRKGKDSINIFIAIIIFPSKNPKMSYHNHPITVLPDRPLLYDAYNR